MNSGKTLKAKGFHFLSTHARSDSYTTFLLRFKTLLLLMENSKKEQLYAAPCVSGANDNHTKYYIMFDLEYPSKMFSSSMHTHSTHATYYALLSKDFCTEMLTIIMLLLLYELGCEMDNIIRSLISWEKGRRKRMEENSESFLLFRSSSSSASGLSSIPFFFAFTWSYKWRNILHQSNRKKCYHDRQHMENQSLNVWLSSSPLKRNWKSKYLGESQWRRRCIDEQNSQMNKKQGKCTLNLSPLFESGRNAKTFIRFTFFYFIFQFPFISGKIM